MGIQSYRDRLSGNHPGYTSGNWYNPFPVAVQTGTAISANSLRLLPFWLPKPMPVADLAARVATADVTGGTAFGLAPYASDPATKKPTGNPLLSALGLSVATAQAVPGNIGAKVPLPPGLYWPGVITNSASVAFTTVLQGAALGSHLVGSATLANIASANTASILYLVYPWTYGTWPDLTGAAVLESQTNGSAAVLLKAT